MNIEQAQDAIREIESAYDALIREKAELKAAVKRRDDVIAVLRKKIDPDKCPPHPKGTICDEANYCNECWDEWIAAKLKEVKL